mmetsp:Transcript_13603/g.24643  ORF Transcript_13603/g.24643 Transcript_13603/m.24643 type:complete len:82 (-) Transcript_13603:1109-1354(-)
MWLELQGVDLESIYKSIIEGNASNCYRDRSKLVLTALAVARGGEVAVSAVAPARNSSITDWFSKAKTRVANVLSPGRSQHR